MKRNIKAFYAKRLRAIGGKRVCAGPVRFQKKECLLAEQTVDVPAPEDPLSHVVILPVAKEPREVLAPAVKAIAQHSSDAAHHGPHALEERPRKKQSSRGTICSLNTGTLFDFRIVLLRRVFPGEARSKGPMPPMPPKPRGYWNTRRSISKNVIVSLF